MSKIINTYDLIKNLSISVDDLKRRYRIGLLSNHDDFNNKISSIEKQVLTLKTLNSIFKEVGEGNL